MFPFEDKVLEMLVTAGWSETYRFDISRYLEWYKLYGSIPSEQVIHFLLHFGGLHIGTATDRSARSALPFNLDPYPMLYRTKPCVEYALLAELEGIDPCSIFHIGRACNDYMDFLMVSDGRVYLSFDETILFVAGSGTDAIETLCLDKELVVINAPN